MKSRWLPAGLLYTFFSTALLVSCGKDGDDNNGSGGNNNQNPVTNTTSVTISNMAFSPNRLTVKAGTTVTWVNDESMSHTVTSDNGAFGSGTLRQGDTFKHTFSSAGTYPYHCNLHTGMKATVVVE